MISPSFFTYSLDIPSSFLNLPICSLITFYLLIILSLLYIDPTSSNSVGLTQYQLAKHIPKKKFFLHPCW
eukprot:c8388_g2_i1 orf=3-209(-)